jgi:hypothetical protein
LLGPKFVLLLFVLYCWFYLFLINPLDELFIKPFLLFVLLLIWSRVLDLLDCKLGLSFSCLSYWIVDYFYWFCLIYYILVDRCVKQAVCICFFKSAALFLPLAELIVICISIIINNDFFLSNILKIIIK